MLIDSHCHLASHQFSANEIPEIVARANDAGVTQMISLATDLDDIAANLRFADLFPQVKICVGIHPCHVHEAPQDVMEKLAPHARHENVVAIGETGLDYYHPAPEGWAENDFRTLQKNLLEKHFQLAAETKKNIVIHTRDKNGTASFDDALEIYIPFKDRVRAMFHCFISTRDNAQKVLDAGGIVSFGGVSTFKNASAVLAVAASMPAGTFTIETDAPYLAPVPHRGKRNEPSYTRHTAEFLAQARGETLASLAAHTSATARNFFHI